MAVDAADFNGRPHLAVELRVAVHVLHEVAVDAVHAALHVNVEQVHRKPVALVGHGRLLAAQLEVGLGVGVAVDLFDLFGHLDSSLEGRVTNIVNAIASVIQQEALPVVFQHRPIRPAMAVKICKLGLLRAGVQVGEVG